MKLTIARVLTMTLLLAPGAASAQGYVLETSFESCAATGVIQPAAWNSTFGSAFPSHSGGIVLVSATSGSVNAVSFVASSANSTQGRVLTNAPSGGGQGTAQMSISPFPGCFDPALVPAVCRSESQLPSVAWSFNALPDRCVLIPGRTYFLNIGCAGQCSFTMTSVAD